MSDKTRLDPQSAHTAARRLSGLSNGLAQAWAAAKAEIDGINAQRPWGHDDAGKSFDQNYSKGNSPDGPAAQTLKTGDMLVGRLQKLGPLVQSAVDGVIDADHLAAELMKPDGGSPAAPHAGGSPQNRAV